MPFLSSLYSSWGKLNHCQLSVSSTVLGSSKSTLNFNGIVYLRWEPQSLKARWKNNQQRVLSCAVYGWSIKMLHFNSTAIIKEWDWRDYWSVPCSSTSPQICKVRKGLKAVPKSVQKGMTSDERCRQGKLAVLGYCSNLIHKSESCYEPMSWAGICPLCLETYRPIRHCYFSVKLRVSNGV